MHNFFSFSPIIYIDYTSPEIARVDLLLFWIGSARRWLLTEVVLFLSELFKNGIVWEKNLCSVFNGTTIVTEEACLLIDH
jgi:hypothetical protein